MEYVDVELDYEFDDILNIAFYVDEDDNESTDKNEIYEIIFEESRFLTEED